MLCLQGLGKTLQTISLVAYLHEYRGIKGPHIVIVPKSTLGNWMNEFRRFCPVIKTIKFHGNAEDRVRQHGCVCSTELPTFVGSGFTLSWTHRDIVLRAVIQLPAMVICWWQLLDGFEQPLCHAVLLLCCALPCRALC